MLWLPPVEIVMFPEYTPTCNFEASTVTDAVDCPNAGIVPLVGNTESQFAPEFTFADAEKVCAELL